MSANDSVNKLSFNITASKVATPAAVQPSDSAPQTTSSAFPSSDDLALQEAAGKVLKKLDKLDAWHVQYAPLRTGIHKIPDEVQSQVLEYRRLATNLQVAASVPVALALYGASQAGKSLFVGNLVKSIDQKQTALGVGAGDGTPANLDFQIHLNPHRKGEATAVVTRFSAGARSGNRHEIQMPPVRARLFSRCDIIKALSRGFFSECKYDSARKWNAESLEALLAEESKGTSVDIEWRADLVEAYRYISKEIMQNTFEEDADAFGRMLMRRPLSQLGYFKIACALFFDGWEELAALFKSLLDLRQKTLKSHEFVYMGWEPLMFILDTTITASIPAGDRTEPFGGKSLNWNDYKLDVSGTHAILGSSKRSGKCIELALLQGLISEIQVPLILEHLAPKSRQLFAGADVLDIPGAIAGAGRAAMTRNEFSNQMDKDERPDFRILKRGKVGLLFEKYAEEKQASILLYLQGIGNLNAKSELVPQIELWGKASFNNEWPAGLTKMNQRLFVGITNIDALIGTRPDSESLDKHIGELVADFSKWMTNYGGMGQLFADVHLIRYPDTMDALKYSDTQRLNEWKQAYLNSEKVKLHISDADSRWEDAFKSDGGAEKLLDRVIGLVNNDQRRAELIAEIDEISTTISSVFRQFWIDPSVEAEANRRRENARRVIEWLDNDQYGRRTSYLLDYLHCSEDHIPAALEAEKPPKDIPVPASVDFNRVVRTILLHWSLQNAQCESERSLSAHDHISTNILVSLRGYIREYLEQVCVDQIAELLKPICARDFQGDTRNVMLRYAAMVVDDFIVTPGPRDTEQHEYREIEIPFKGLVERYKRILEQRLVQGCAGEGIAIPPGNAELGEMITTGSI